MKPCKHGHVDGVMHKPCPQCTADLRFENEMLLCGQIDTLKERIEALEAKHTALEDGLLNLPTYDGYLVPNDVYALLGKESGDE